MYHQVAPSGAPRFPRYRVVPEAFEKQLQYLRDAGFRGVTLGEWREAMQRWEPLPGRAVLLTFDDGYLDSERYAWPLLRQHGFSAIAFLVADRVGGTNSWDPGRRRAGSGALARDPHEGPGEAGDGLRLPARSRG
jgi:peptidoglycan/xylan/chitin deacetylase (PgdA/CDA1 family)